MPPPLVLLFYDGYERKARPGLGAIYAELHRAARYSYKHLRRQHPWSGFYTVFLMLAEALRYVGAEVRINDFAAASNMPDHPIGIAGYGAALDAVRDLPNPRLIGPGVTLSPWEPAGLYDDARNKGVIVHCDWLAEVMRPWHDGRLWLWFAGFDLTRYRDGRDAPKQYDLLIYDKIYHRRDDYYPRTIGALSALLEAVGLTSTIVRYGHYHLDDYKRLLQASRAMAFFSHAETQGIAYQEALASNVPVFAWDEGAWLDPLAAKLGPDPVLCSSVPFWDERCGRTFKVAGLADEWRVFWAAIAQYEPRAFVADRLSLQRSAEAYLSAYFAAGQR